MSAMRVTVIENDGKLYLTDESRGGYYEVSGANERNGIDDMLSVLNGAPGLDLLHHDTHEALPEPPDGAIVADYIDFPEESVRLHIGSMGRAAKDYFGFSPE